MNPFRLTLATDDLFCNRVAEIDLLMKNMLSGIHTVVYAPRRYGKSSLARVVMGRLEKKMVGVYVDLFSITSNEDVAAKLYRCIVQALGHNAADHSSVMSRIAGFFKNLRLSMSFDPITKNPEISVSLGDVTAVVHIETVIGALDEYCAKQKIKVCLILDEFQEICTLKDSKKIEALLRSGMQAAKHVSFMMLGSRRTILRDMFEDRKRPFYKSAYIMPLPKIPETEMVPFLVKTFKKGGTSLLPEQAQQIVTFCDSYPYYIQKLSMLFFDMKAKGNALSETQELLIAMEAPDYENIFINLTMNQKRLLQAIAKARPINIFSNSFLVDYHLGSQGGIQSSLSKLKKLDLIEQQKDGWKVVDPIFEKWLTI